MRVRPIMHRDINPSDIVWNPQTGQLKLIDFGIATTLAREQPEILSARGVEGTLAYLAPEQTGRIYRAIDSRSDLYPWG
jgi:serine/threonine protein kinase